MDSRNIFLVLPSQHQPLPVSLSSLAGLPKSVATEELQALEALEEWAIFGGKTMREIGCGQQKELWLNAMATKFLEYFVNECSWP